MGRSAVSESLELGAGDTRSLSLEMDRAAVIAFDVRDGSGEGIPCKVQFIGIDGTASPRPRTGHARPRLPRSVSLRRRPVRSAGSPGRLPGGGNARHRVFPPGERGEPAPRPNRNRESEAAPPRRYAGLDQHRFPQSLDAERRQRDPFPGPRDQPGGRADRVRADDRAQPAFRLAAVHRGAGARGRAGDHSRNRADGPGRPPERLSLRARPVRPGRGRARMAVRPPGQRHRAARFPASLDRSHAGTLGASQPPRHVPRFRRPRPGRPRGRRLPGGWPS